MSADGDAIGGCKRAANRQFDPPKVGWPLLPRALLSLFSCMDNIHFGLDFASSRFEHEQTLVLSRFCQVPTDEKAPGASCVDQHFAI